MAFWKSYRRNSALTLGYVSLRTIKRSQKPMDPPYLQTFDFRQPRSFSALYVASMAKRYDIFWLPRQKTWGERIFFSPTKTQTISPPFHRATYQNTSEQEPHSWDLTLWTHNNFNLYCRFKWDITYRTLSCTVNVFQGNCTLINNLKNNLRESCHDRTFGVIAEIRLRYLLLCFSFTK